VQAHQFHQPPTQTHQPQTYRRTNASNRSIFDRTNHFFMFMRHILLLCVFALCTNFNCKKENVSDVSGTSNGKKLEGKWLLVKSEVLLKFDDGTTQSATVPSTDNDYMELKWTSKDGKEDKGTIKNVYLGDESTGTWVYFEEDNKSLDITYTSLSPHFFIYRVVTQLDDKTLVLTANDSKVVDQYTNNGLADLGTKKLVGGSIREEWKRG
jgi:hypothetical protein